MSQLRAKQARFVDESRKDLNGTQAAIRTGYSPHAAAQQANRLLKNAKVKAVIQKRSQEIALRNEISIDSVMSRLNSVANRCMQAEAVLDREGNKTGAYTFDSSGANKALELLGKYLGAFKENEEIKEITVNFVGWGNNKNNGKIIDCEPAGELPSKTIPAEISGGNDQRRLPEGSPGLAQESREG